MKTILRNFLSILRRFKMATLLNIFGLSVAFAAFMIIMIQLDYDRSFDTFHPDADKIFRMEFIFKDKKQAIISRPLAELFIASSPHIVTGTFCDPNPWGYKTFFSIEENGVKHAYEEDMQKVSPEYTDVFTFDFVEGTKDVLREPDRVMIPLSLSQKLFGNRPAVGKQIVERNGSSTIGAVYRDFPSNSLVRNRMYFSIPEDENKQNWGNWNYYVYIRVDDAVHVPLLFENFKQHFDPKAVWGDDFSWEESGTGLRFTALQDVHYVTDVAYDSAPKAGRQTLRVLFAIALVIVIIAGINFTNFSTALAPMRIKSINTQKVLGSDPRTIRRLLVQEAVLISLFSYLLSIEMIVLFSRTSLASLVDADLSVAAHPFLIGGTAFIAVMTGLAASVYPARYMTSFPPALALKGSFGLSPKGRQLRNVLIGIQFMASFALIIGASFMYLQNYYMQHTPLGYNTDRLIVTKINETVLKSKDALTNQLKTFAGIEEVTYAESLLSSSDQYMGWGQVYKGKEIWFQCLPVDYTFLQVMGIKVSEGRDFRIEDTKGCCGAYVFNEKARDAYGLELGTKIDGAVIAGFMPDIKFASFRTEVIPMTFFVRGAENWRDTLYNDAYIKVKAGSDMRAAVSHVRSSLAQFDAEYPFNIRFFDEVMQQLYEKETSLSSLITLFSLVAIFISMAGVFGLVVFDSEYRKKEIGLRKISGSTTREILILFNRTYVRILCLCFVPAAPVAWYAVTKWLQNFAYRTPMYWWVYLFAFATVGIMTICTVTFQSRRAANDNPVNSIKAE